MHLLTPFVPRAPDLALPSVGLDNQTAFKSARGAGGGDRAPVSPGPTSPVKPPSSPSAGSPVPRRKRRSASPGRADGSGIRGSALHTANAITWPKTAVGPLPEQHHQQQHQEHHQLTHHPHQQQQQQRAVGGLGASEGGGQIHYGFDEDGGPVPRVQTLSSLPSNASLSGSLSVQVSTEADRGSVTVAGGVTL